MMFEFGKRKAFALRARGEQHRAHAGGLADAIGVHVAGHVLDGVVNREPRRDAAAGRIDVEMHVLLRIGHLEEQQLRDDDVGDLIVHGRAEEQDAVHQQAGINVPTPFAAPGLFDDDGNEKIFRFKLIAHQCGKLAEASGSVKKCTVPKSARRA
jgi:hypothetical protein